MAFWLRYSGIPRLLFVTIGPLGVLADFALIAKSICVIICAMPELVGQCFMLAALSALLSLTRAIAIFADINGLLLLHFGAQFSLTAGLASSRKCLVSPLCVVSLLASLADRANFREFGERLSSIAMATDFRFHRTPPCSVAYLCRCIPWRHAAMKRAPNMGWEQHHRIIAWVILTAR
jgi:hypothetical protein